MTTEEEIFGAEPKKTMKVKFKPVYNFQSVEIEVEFTNTQEIIDYLTFDYVDILEALKDSTDNVMPQQQKIQTRQTPVNTEEMPSARQYELMDSYGIAYDNRTTRKEAIKLIKESINNSK